MSQSKVLRNKNKNLIIATSILAIFGYCAAITDLSYANENIDTTLSSWHPYKNYLNAEVPQQLLNEKMPVGLTLGELQTLVKTSYVAKEKPLYIKGILIANKQYGLPSTFNSTGEVPIARQKFNEMQEAAKKDSIYLTAFSTYRSYQRQEVLYSNYIARDGQKAADTYSAKPGHSEHQTGLTFDIGGRDSSAHASTRFNNTKEANWLLENAHKYGFILRYPQGKEHITGYMHESWHYRYVGTEWSTLIHESGLSLEEFTGLDRLNKIGDYL